MRRSHPLLFLLSLTNDPFPTTKDPVAQLRRDLQERDDVMALVAHELRNPLHALSLQLAVARSTAQALEGAGDTLARIEKAQRTLVRYTDRVTVLLDLMTARGGDYPTRPRHVDLPHLLAGLAESLASEAKFRGVTLGVVAPQACTAFLDPLVVEQILDNLLLNAFKHSACTHVALSLSLPEPGWASIAVIDNGRGVDLSDRDHIFGKFDVSRQSGRGTGSGLGLWIVRRLSAVLGGSISLHCPPEGGCAFILRCPLVMPERALPANPVSD